MPAAKPSAAALAKAKADRAVARAARREKQRASNGLRAAKMHAARLADKAERKVITLKEKYYIGCSGWFYWHWRGTFYEQDAPTSTWFDHYSDTFKTVELNAPFYSWPTIATVQSWVRQAKEKKLCYTVKVSELITHTKRFVGTKMLVRDFCYIADLLGPYMGCFLFQLPPSYHYSKTRLNSIISQLDHSRRNVLEFRHPSWWNETVYQAFREHGTIFCSCSGPRLPDELVKTADDIYLRFHGVERWYRHDYSYAELAVWARRIKDSGAKKVWAYFNNDFNANAIKNAQTLERMLRRKVSG